jgi:aromatic-L-amino-acid decarboxylase
VARAQRLTRELQRRGDIELLAPQVLSVIVFRKKGSDEENAALLERINASGKLFVSHTRLRGRYGIRVAIGNGATEWHHLEPLLELIR